MKNVYTGTGPNKKCDLCPASEKHDAEYDAPTIHGPWANMCSDHYATAAAPGADAVAYRLLWGEEPTRTKAEVKADILDAIDRGDADEVWDLVGDGDLLDFL